MMNEGRLQSGQIIRCQGENMLWRVEYANDCRAFITPLGKRHVELPNGAEFDATGRGRNIAPTSFVEIIEDVESARDQMELEAVEAEIAEAKQLLAQPATSSSAPLRATPRTATTHKREPVKPGGGWYMVDPGNFKDGTLAATVMTYIVAFPGKSTADIVKECKVEGAVAACVSRFHQAGLIQKK